ncbi:ATP-binding protein [Terricaulis sp.]|uniref:ATP-binding protein n=1 Tax=Terricaulis sp. TaxID=2768686 RepID=UPI0037844DA9
MLAASAVGFLLLLLNLSVQHEAVMDNLVRMRQARMAGVGLLQATIDAETGQRGYLLTNDEEYLAPLASGRIAARARLSELRERAGASGELEPQLVRVAALTEDALGALERTIELKRSGRLRAAALRVELDRAKASMDPLRTEISGVLRQIERISESGRARERSTRGAIYWIGGLLGALTVLAVGLTLWALGLERRSWRGALEALTRANEAAERAAEMAAASDLAKTRFLAVASHDMRQPLHALTLYLSALERRVQGEEARDILSRMERATQSMVGMFATLLDLARIQANAVKPEIEICALDDIIARVVDNHADGAVEAATTGLYVSSDPVLLERLLRNLVANAVKHGGGKARIEMRKAGDVAEIAVADDGPGIPPEERERVFEEFVRLDKSGGVEGLGLGLAIVKRIADILRMPLELQSAPGQGARFIVRPPLAMAQTRAPSAPTPPGLMPLTGVPVLVMDDDPLAREAVSGALRDLGAVVQACANESGVRAALTAGARPRLMVMDLRIDGQLQGIEIARRARAELDPPPAIIMITGDTGPETLEALRASAFKWLIKPVDPRDLSEAASASLKATISA